MKNNPNSSLSFMCYSISFSDFPHCYESHLRSPNFSYLISITLIYSHHISTLKRTSTSIRSRHKFNISLSFSLNLHFSFSILDLCLNLSFTIQSGRLARWTARPVMRAGYGHASQPIFPGRAKPARRIWT